QYVATYSWSREGGFNSREPTYTGSRDSGSGGNFSFSALTGYSAEDPLTKSWSFKAMFGGHLNLTVKKDESSDDTISLKTSFDDKLDSDNLKPNQFASYSWVTFCTDESVTNFDTLFNLVIDRKWLIGDSPTAKSFRDMMRSRRPLWRILHRVTDT